MRRSNSRCVLHSAILSGIRLLPGLNLLALVLAAVLVACDPESPPTPTAVEQPQPTAVSVSTSAPTPAPTEAPAPTPAPTSTPTPESTLAPTSTLSPAPTVAPPPTPAPMPTLTTSAQLALSDWQVLEALFHAAGGPYWENSEGWLTDTPIGQWHGVTATSEGRVASLDLADNGLEGEIPPELGDLTELRQLSLTRNRLSGQIPPELGNLRNLTLLWLSGNALSGEIPPELSALRNLDRLYLANNELSGEVPPWLGNLSRLQYLSLAANQFSGQIPPELGNLRRLLSLTLSFNSLSGEIPSELANLSGLTTLWLSENALSGEIPWWLGNLASLDRLTLGDSGLTGCIPGELQDQLDPAKDPGMPFCAASAIATSTATFAPTPTPEPPPYIRWDVGDEVDPSDMKSAILSVSLIHEFAQSMGLPDPVEQITITIYKDREKMARKYSVDTGLSLEASQRYWEQASAVAGRRSIHALAPVSLTSMVHELAHTNFQTGLVGFSEHKGGMSPRWLGEGTAELVVTLLLREGYPKALNQGQRSRAETISRALSTGVTLRDAEVWPPSEYGRVGTDEAGLNKVSCIYSCGYLAAELLASHIGVSKLFDYYKHVEAWMEPWDYAGRGEDPPREWRQAFEDAYGMTVQEFYELFEEHRAAGFPKPSADWFPEDEDECDKETMDPGPLGNRVASPDREALVAFFNATCGLNWNESEGWLTDAPIGQWHGVTVDGSGRVIELEFRKNGLRGELPRQLGSLARLQTLSLPNNALSGEIPPELGNLESLSGLNLENNRLSGRIPPELGNLTNLTWMVIGWNRLSGEIPAELGNLTNLRTLRLDNELLTGCVPSNLQNQLTSQYHPGKPFC